MAETYFRVGECPRCKIGGLGVRCCSACGRPHVVCDQCRALWSTRDTTQPPASVARSDASCVQCGQSLLDGITSWATWQELIELDWPSPNGESGAGRGEVRSERGSAGDALSPGGGAASQAEG